MNGRQTNLRVEFHLSGNWLQQYLTWVTGNSRCPIRLLDPNFKEFQGYQSY